MRINVTSDGWLESNGKKYRCALGKNGVTPQENKREGDSKTPLGEYPLLRVFWRDDKLASKPKTDLPLTKITKSIGWCDDVIHPSYNQLIDISNSDNLPSHEKMWRDEDDCYDIVVELGHNNNPPIPSMGSAIFMHIAKDGYTPTEGCVALLKEDLLEILSFNPTIMNIGLNN